MTNKARRPARSPKRRSPTGSAGTAGSTSAPPIPSATPSAQSSTSDSSGSTRSGETGRPSEFKPEYVEQAFKFCLLGATDKQLGEFFDVTEQTINNWKVAHPEFFESIKRGKEVADAEVANSLYRRALGFDHPAVKIMQYEGSPVVVPYTEKYPPDTAAAIFWMKNRQKASWRDRIEHAGDPENPLMAAVIVVPKKDVGTASPVAPEPKAG